MGADNTKRKKKTLCDIHDEIESICKEIQQIDKNSPHFNRQVKSRIEKIKALSDSAKFYGKRMEHRLQEYYDGIVSLGFLRTK